MNRTCIYKGIILRNWLTRLWMLPGRCGFYGEKRMGTWPAIPALSYLSPLYKIGLACLYLFQLAELGDLVKCFHLLTCLMD